MADSTEEINYHDENTLRKVYAALLEMGIYGQKAVDIVSTIQNKGIFFRERRPKRRGRPPGSKNRDKNLEERVIEQTFGKQEQNERTKELEADLNEAKPKEDPWSPNPAEQDGFNGA